MGIDCGLNSAIGWRRFPNERTAIAARSDRDRGFFHVLSVSSDGASGERMATIARSRGPRC